MPTQVDGTTATVISAFGSASAAAVGSSFSLNFLLNMLMSTSMNQMLASMKALQIIIHLSLMNVKVPANAQQFNGFISSMVVYDPINVED